MVNEHLLIIVILIMVTIFAILWYLSRRYFSIEKRSAVEEDGAPLIKIAPLQDSEISKYDFEELQLSDELKSEFGTYISPLIQQAPNLAMTAKHATSYIATFSPEVTKGLKDGIMHLVKAKDGSEYLAVVANEKERFSGIGMLNKGLSPTTGALMVWQFLAVITAQKFLSDINKRLANIEKGVEDIKEWLEEEQRSKIKGNLKYLLQRNILNMQKIREVDVQTFNNKLEDIEQESLQIMFHIQKHVEDIRKSIKEFNPKKKDIEKSVKTLGENINNFTKKTISYLLILQTRAVTAQFKTFLPADQTPTIESFKEILKMSEEEILLQKELKEIVKNKIAEMERKIPWWLYLALLPSPITFLSPVRVVLDVKAAIKEIESEKEKIRRIEQQKLDGIFDSLTSNYENLMSVIQDTLDNIERKNEELSKPINILIDVNEKGEVGYVKKVLNYKYETKKR